MKEVWVGYNVGCTVGFHLGHSAWQIDQFPTCWPMNGLFVHWSRGWGVSSFSERLVIKFNLLLINIGSGNGLVPPGTKPLSEPMLTKCYRTPYGITRPQWVNCKLRIDEIINHVLHNAGLILALLPANEKHCYKVTPFLIGWAQTYNQPW